MPMCFFYVFIRIKILPVICIALRIQIQELLASESAVGLLHCLALGSKKHSIKKSIANESLIQVSFVFIVIL